MIFLSYVSEDRERVLPYYDMLNSHGLEPWIDINDILGGHNWDYEIRTALDRSDVVVVFVSHNSVDKRGYAQREIALAIKKSEERLHGEVYIIPVQLDEGEFPRILRGLHFVRGSEQEIKEQLLRAIKSRVQDSVQKNQVDQKDSEVNWYSKEYSSAYMGIPGYSIKVHKITLSSEKYPEVREICDHINGVFAGYAMNARRACLDPDPINYNLLQTQWRRTNSFDAIFSSVKVVGRVISISYYMHWYNAGAAHPVHAPQVFNYLLDPIYNFRGLEDLFSSNRLDGALKLIQRASMHQLLEMHGSETEDWIRSGTSGWDQLKNFSFDEGGIIIQFSSYQVASYAAGMPKIFIPYEQLIDSFSAHVFHALDLHHAHFTE